jgi:long-subunit acyl-CoA synthetase (AMP-forming)
MPQEKLDKVLGIPVVSRVVKKKILKGLGLDKARIAISASAPIPAELIQWYQNLGLELLEGYGMSENFAYSHSSEEGASRPGYVGTAMPEVEVRLSEEGEVLVKSPANMLGYYKQPELTQASFTEDGFLKTGDRGEIDPHGRLRITGRTKELFKSSKGKYVAPAPIENMLNAHPMVEQSCVTGNGYPQPLALLLLSEELRTKSDLDRAALGAELEQLLASVNRKVEAHERLEFLAVVAEDWQIDNGFLTPTMKIKRNIVEDAYKGMYDAWYAGKAPVVWAEPSATAISSMVGQTVRPEGAAASDAPVVGQGRPTAEG